MKTREKLQLLLKEGILFEAATTGTLFEGTYDGEHLILTTLREPSQTVTHHPLFGPEEIEETLLEGNKITFPNSDMYYLWTFRRMNNNSQKNGWTPARAEALNLLDELINTAGSLNKGSHVCEKIHRLQEICEILLETDYKTPRPNFPQFLKNLAIEARS